MSTPGLVRSPHCLGSKGQVRRWCASGGGSIRGRAATTQWSPPRLHCSGWSSTQACVCVSVYACLCTCEFCRGSRQSRLPSHPGGRLPGWHLLMPRGGRRAERSPLPLRRLPIANPQGLHDSTPTATSCHLSRVTEIERAKTSGRSRACLQQSPWTGSGRQAAPHLEPARPYRPRLWAQDSPLPSPTGRKGECECETPSSNR